MSAVNWDEDPQGLLQYFDSEKNPQVLASAITSAGRAQVDEGQPQILDESIWKKSVTGNDDGVVTLALNYLTNNNSDLASDAIARLLSRGTSPAVKEYILSEINSSDILKERFPELVTDLSQ